MDSLLKKMRERLGESLGSIGETSAAARGSDDEESRRAEGILARPARNGRRQGRRRGSLFNQSVSLVPTFALAYLQLGNIFYTTGQRAKAYGFVDNAVQHLDRLSAREKLSAQGYAAFFRTPAEMEEKWSVFAKLYPDAMAGQQNLAVVLWWFDNAFAESAAQLRAVAESRHPRRGYAWMSLGDVELGLGDEAAAAKAYAMARVVGAPQLYLDTLNLPIAKRDYAAADDALAKEDTHQFPAFEVEKSDAHRIARASRGRFTARARGNGARDRRRGPRASRQFATPRRARGRGARAR